MEVTQFTYFQQAGGIDCNPITGEITYGLERLAMYLQGKENVFDLVWAESSGGAGRAGELTYRDVYHQNEVEQSTYNFEQSNAPKLFELFAFFESEAKRLLEAKLALPGYEMILKAAHTFNLLDARGAISVTERAAYIGRIRTLSRLVAQAYVDSREALGFPMLADEHQDARGMSVPSGPPQIDDASHRRSGSDAPGRSLQAPEGAAPVPMSGNATLVVELLTEELPPKALRRSAKPSPTASSRSHRPRVPDVRERDRPVRDAAAAGRRRSRKCWRVASDTRGRREADAGEASRAMRRASRP